MSNALTLKGLQSVNNLTVRNELLAKQLISDNVVEVNGGHRDYGQLVMGAASKISGAVNIAKDTVLLNGAQRIDFVRADGSSAEKVQSKELGPGADSASHVQAPMFNPNDSNLNPGPANGTWRTNEYLNALEAGGGFTATQLQRDMAALIDGTADNISVIDLTNTNHNSNLSDYTAAYNLWLDPAGNNSAGIAPIAPEYALGDANNYRSNYSLYIFQYNRWLGDNKGKNVPHAPAYATGSAADRNAYDALYKAYDIAYTLHYLNNDPEPARVADPPMVGHGLSTTHQFEVIDAGVRKGALVLGFSPFGVIYLDEPLIIHSGGAHRVSVFPKTSFSIQGRTRENKFIFSQTSDTIISDLIDESKAGHLADNRRVAIEAGPVISYVSSGPTELDLVPQMVFQNASEKWRVALVPDRTTYEDEFGNTIQGDGLLKLMVQRYMPVAKSVTYKDDAGVNVTADIHWETVTSFTGSTGVLATEPSPDSSKPVGYTSS